MVVLRFERQRVFYRADYFALVHRFAAVQFKAEFAYPYIRQTLFNYVQSRLLFGDEQHALAPVESVGNYVCYSLALARSGRTVQNERSALVGFRNGGILRAVAGQRRKHFRGVGFVLVHPAELIVGEFVCVFKQTGNQRIAPVLVNIVPYVPPHRIARKRKLREIHVLVDKPALHIRRFGTEYCKRFHGR